MQKNCIVLGGGGFIGSHAVTRLKAQGHRVIAADLKKPEFGPSAADVFVCCDLANASDVRDVFSQFGHIDDVWQLAADMGGAGYIFSGEHDAEVMSNSALINLHVAKACVRYNVGKVFYSSSACAYPQGIQHETVNPGLREIDAYPADPDSEYGWEKLFSERLYAAFHRNHGLDIRVARFHNIFGPDSCFDNGKEKAPAAMCRKVAAAPANGTIEVWGDGLQTRSFLYIDDCLDGVEALMASDCREPVNIGSSESISINDLAGMAMDIADKSLAIKHIVGPLGVRGRTSDNTFCEARIGWKPQISLRTGMEHTYKWIADQLRGR